MPEGGDRKQSLIKLAEQKLKIGELDFSQTSTQKEENRFRTVVPNGGFGIVHVNQPRHRVGYHSC